MNAKKIAQIISSTCQDLSALDLLFCYNSPCVEVSRGRARVSYPCKVMGSANAHPFGSLDQYLEWVRQGEFTCLLFDFSLIRVSYECVGNSVIGHNLLYWPCPVEFFGKVESLSDLCDGIELCINSPRSACEIVSLSMRTPMRFDFDPTSESEEHALVHLHTQFDDTRIFVQQAMCFPSFMKKIIRTFYYKKWDKLLPDIHDIPEYDIVHDESKYNPNNNCFHISWT